MMEMPKVPYFFSERELEAMKLEMGERAFNAMLIQNNYIMQGLVEGLVSRWQCDENLMVLFKAKKEQPELLAQAVGQMNHDRRVRQYMAATRR